MIKALDVAWFFLRKGGQDSDITQLKIQKLTYYAQGYFLGLYGKPLFYEPIKAWKLGPVITSLRELQVYGRETIVCTDPFGRSIEDIDAKKVLESVWQSYGGFSADMLVAMTHAEPPWKDTFNNGAGEGDDIPLQSLKDYFSKRIQDLPAFHQKLEVQALRPRRTSLS